MTTKKPAREFWIPVYEGRARLMCYRQEPVGAMSEDIAHVIEYSAYSALAQKLKEVEALYDEECDLAASNFAALQESVEKNIEKAKEIDQLRESLAVVMEALDKNCSCGIYKRPDGPIKIQCWACEFLAKIREKHGELK